MTNLKNFKVEFLVFNICGFVLLNLHPHVCDVYAFRFGDDLTPRIRAFEIVVHVATTLMKWQSTMVITHTILLKFHIEVQNSK
jgi:hypothetical protein